MRYMMIVKANADSEAGVLPTETELADMTAYNEELVMAGVMLDGNGLQPSSAGVRVRFGDNDSTTVVDGPFTEAKDLIAGYWIIDVKSKDEAIEWARQIPFGPGSEVEIRKVAESEDFGDSLTPEIREAEARMRDEIARQHG